MLRGSNAWAVAALVGTLLLPATGVAQIAVKGEISGVVMDQSEAVLPGVTVTITGEKLFQKSLTVVTDRVGAFRFLNLTPGEYQLEFTLQGMSTVRMTGVNVDLGRTTPIRASMAVANVSEQVQVEAKGVTIETVRPQITVNYSSEFIEKLPTATRNYIDVMNASPGINDNTAYGTSGNVSFSGFTTGSMTSAFRFNGVDVSDPAFGYSAISPIFESIEEIQVVGLGASAEYGNFEGASVNVVTKSGTNTLHGSANFLGTSKGLYGDNSGGVFEYRPNDYRYNVETTGTLGGPIIKEKLFYFAAGGYSNQKWKYYYASDFQRNKVRRYQAKADWVVNPSQTLSIMYNGNPAVQEKFSFAEGQAPSTAYDYEQSMNTVFGSWRSVLNSRTLLDVRFAGYKNEIKAVPQFPGIPPYTDNATGRSYGSGPFDRSIPARRFEVDPALTLGQRHALGATHDLKIGLELEKSKSGEERVYSGGGSFNSLPLAGGLTQWTVQAGGNLHNSSYLSRVALFVQDDLALNQHLRLSLGLRYERPKLTAEKFSGSVATFNIVSPRVGFTYDLKGDATNVFRGSFGRYYNKVLAQTYYPALPGNDDARVYQAVLPTDAFPGFNPNDAASLTQMFATLTQPQYLYQVYTYSIPATVDPNLKLNGSDQLSIGFDRALGTKTSLSGTYMFRRGRNRYQLESAAAAQHSYEQVSWTDPWLGHTVQVWQQLDKIPDTNLVLTNSSWEKTRTHMAILVMRHQFTRGVSIMASYTYQNTKSNVSGNGSSDLFGFPDYNVDTDPQYFENPLAWGHQWDRPHQFKLSGNYVIPGGVVLGGNLRAVSSVPWQPQVGTSVTNQGQLNLPVGTGTRITRTIGSPILLLDPRGSHRGPMTWNLDLRLAKKFKFGNSRSLEPQVDILNALNAGYYYNVQQTPYAVYASSKRPSYGLPTRLFDPRSARLGLVWKF